MHPDADIVTQARPGAAELAREYYRRLDAGRADLLDLFAEDAQFYFPKFGIAKAADGAVALAIECGRAMQGQ